MTHNHQEYELKPVLKPLHIWAIAVGLVISGDYFGWNYGLKTAGPFGMLLATLLITVMYITFIFSYTELTTSIPNSGGPYAYARKAMGPYAGFIAGMATLIEFVFAPPAIALAIGAYLNFIAGKFGFILPTLVTLEPKVWLALFTYVFFITLNMRGIKDSANFELAVTIVAILELLIFCAVTFPQVKVENLVTTPLLPFGSSGIFSAIPFAIWFYLAIEGVAMSAEETENPKKDIPVGYISGIVTLVILALATSICAVGVVPWEQLAGEDKPLPKAVEMALAPGHWLTNVIAVVGVFGLIASFNGIIIGYSRQTFALARARYLPLFLAKLTPKTQVPYWALIVPGIIGALACLTAYTDQIITISAIGAIILYLISMLSLFILRKKEPELERPFKAPFYPLFPLIATIISLISFVSIAYYNFTLLLWTMLIFVIGTFYYFAVVKNDVIREGDLLSLEKFEKLRKTGELPQMDN